MDSKVITQTFSGKVGWNLRGNYFKLMESANPVTVELFKNGQLVLLAEGQEAGYYQRIDFDRCEITTGGSETVAWLYAPAEGGSDRFSGIVDVTDDAARLLGIVYGNLGQIAQRLIAGVNASVTTQWPHDYGASFFTQTAGAVTVVSDASNVSGVIVWAARVAVSNRSSGGAGTMSLLAKTSAPGSVSDGDALLVASCYENGNVNMVHDGAELQRPVIVPAGKGIYTYGAGSGVMGRALYTVL